MSTGPNTLVPPPSSGGQSNHLQISSSGMGQFMAPVAPGVSLGSRASAGVQGGPTLMDPSWVEPYLTQHQLRMQKLFEARPELEEELRALLAISGLTLDSAAVSGLFGMEGEQKSIAGEPLIAWRVRSRKWSLYCVWVDNKLELETVRRSAGKLLDLVVEEREKYRREGRAEPPDPPPEPSIYEVMAKRQEYIKQQQMKAAQRNQLMSQLQQYQQVGTNQPAAQPVNPVPPEQTAKALGILAAVKRLRGLHK